MLLQHRVFKLQIVRDGRAWDVHLDLVRDPALPFYVTSTRVEDGREIVSVQINLDHEFSINHLNYNEAALQPVIRLVAALALSEKVARESGVKNAGTIRMTANQLLLAIASTRSHS